MATKQMEPDQDSWKDQERRQRRQVRNRKIRTFAAVAVILIAAGMFLLSQRRAGTGRPAHAVPPAPAAIGARQTTEIVGLDGTVQRTIPGLPPNAYGLAVSPDGSQVAFADGPLEEARIGIIAIDGSHSRWLTTTGLNADMPAWSPDGTKLAFVATATGSSNGRDLYVIDADGSNLRQLTSDAASEDQPNWSPDGSTIMYRSGSKREFNNDQEIWTIPADGGSPTRLTHDQIPDEEPAWSPTGRTIVYVHGTDVWSMGANGSSAHRVMRGAFAPRWSPDGTRIMALKYVSANVPAQHLSFRGSGQHPRLNVVIFNTATQQVKTVPGVEVAGDYATVSWMPSSYGDALVLDNVAGA